LQRGFSGNYGVRCKLGKVFTVAYVPLIERATRLVISVSLLVGASLLFFAFASLGFSQGEI
jgi:hypothetical protein